MTFYAGPLGRIVRFDPRSRNYPIRALISAKKRRSYTWNCPVVLDQGEEGACTGFAVSAEAAARPVRVKGITNDVAFAVYRRARQLDDIPGEDYDGSTTLGAMKAGVERGWYESYRWAFGEDDLALAVGYHGPAVLGIPWFSGMDEVPDDYILKVSGKIRGYHDILCNGYDRKKGLYRLHNSWGPKYGLNGEVFVSADDMLRLLSNQGEACLPVVRKMGK